MSNKTQNKPSYSANRKTGKKQTPSTDSLLESLRTIGRGAGDSVRIVCARRGPENKRSRFARGHEAHWFVRTRGLS